MRNNTNSALQHFIWLCADMAHAANQAIEGDKDALDRIVSELYSTPGEFSGAVRKVIEAIQTDDAEEMERDESAFRAMLAQIEHESIMRTIHGIDQ